ncbi:MAG: type II toxin-antitoxin system RelE/ParE family toxin [Phycisphaeraceae bacterium]|nr:type II toxin-antitoxin system RelE/ParE family toxin [Phycisphaeraceae bacterium]
MNVVFDPLAKLEFDDAFAYYERQQAGLSERFRLAVWTAIGIIERHPHLGREIRPGIRKLVVNRFPYKVIYSVTATDLYVIALAHGHRRPDYWVDRT